MTAADLTGDVAELYKAGMRRLASGVSLITSSDGDERVGLIATAVNSVSMDPPTLLICVNQGASAHNVIERSGYFCVNILTVDDLDLAGQFSNSQRRHERFSTGEWKAVDTGAPALSDALVAFDCSVVEHIRYRSHSIFLGEVRSVHLPEPAAPPLLYMDRQFRQVTLAVAAAS